MARKLWESAEKIVQELNDEIKRNGANIQLEQPGLGWKYGGDFVQERIMRLKVDMEKNGYKVLACTTFHFLKNAKILNPTKHYMLVPMEGSSTLKPGGPLTTLHAHIIYDEPVLESDGGVDMICMALKGKHGENDVSTNVKVERIE